MSVMKLETGHIRPGEYQPRLHFDEAYIDELAASLLAGEQYEPVTVIEASDGHYELIAGEYRWRAAIRAQLPTIDAIVKSGASRQSLIVSALVSNAGRPLSGVEEAKVFERLINEFDITHLDVARLCGKGDARVYIAKAIRLLQLPTAVQNYINEGTLKTSHGHALLTAPESKISSIAEQCVSGAWSVRKLEAMINSISSNTVVKPKKSKLPILQDLEREISDACGLAVEVSAKGKKNKTYTIAVTCKGDDEFQRYMTIIEAGTKV